jgi:hypothetical protein
MILLSKRKKHYFFRICQVFYNFLLFLILFISTSYANIANTSSSNQHNLSLDLFKGIILLIIGSLLAILSEPLRQFLLGKFIRPNLSILFRQNDQDFTSNVPEVIREEVFEKIDDFYKRKVIETNRYSSIYVKAKVLNSKRYIAKSCRVFLINVEKKINEVFERTLFSDSIQLEWSARGEEGFKGIDLPYGVSLYFVVFSTRETEPNKIKLHFHSTPFRYFNLIDNKGTYRITIMVSGDNVIPIFYKLILEWRNQWDNFDIYPEK